MFSTTKCMTSLAALMLVNRGELDLDANVAAYWPEFAARGKAGIKFSQLLSQTSGVSGWDQPITLKDLYDWDKSTALLAAQAPWWEPGTASGYHAMNYGHLIGEVIKAPSRATLVSSLPRTLRGRSAARLPLGLPPSEFHRVANLVPPPATAPAAPADLIQPDPSSVAFKTLTNPTMSVETTWTEGWRRADIGAGQWPRQCPLARAHPVGGGLRRRGRWRPAALHPRRSTESSRCNSTGSTS